MEDSALVRSQLDVGVVVSSAVYVLIHGGRPPDFFHTSAFWNFSQLRTTM